MINSRETLAIVELVVYIPTLVATIAIVIRHGFKRQLGWIYLAIFCTIRIVGSILEILSHKNPSNVSDKEWAGIFQSIGLSPLILASFGLLKRVIDQTSDRAPTFRTHNGHLVVNTLSARFGIVKRILGPATAIARRSRLIQLLQLPATIALILCIVGGVDEASSNESDQKTGPRLFKTGLIMFTVLLVILIILALASLKEIRNTPSQEKRLLFAVIVSLPLLTIRLLWGLLSVFLSHSTVFRISGGSVVAQGCMATLPEFLIVLLFDGVGFLSQRYKAQEIDLTENQSMHAPKLGSKR
ncbi:hypothetical protein D6C84_05431 [Aureobasidium pullulans]|uniref:DUF7702 domain-containing protein n=1 Tax=Aureobasidium pullulans TaxID=5580 RepID=A0A4S9XS10_AURPU|nr:hypothetical protein D6C84_05431 [Aureobasidium pullulans]